eukprot:Colp12_sorted_trinity150504_noHs@24281
MMMKRVAFGKVQQRMMSSAIGDRDVVVVSIARTPVGKLSGSLASLTAPKLGAHAISNALKRSGIDKKHIEEVFMGNVVSAGIGQAPARQAVIYAGLELGTEATTINKVCASGMKAVMLSALSISSGYRDVTIAGGMESMSNIPYYLPGARSGYRLGNNTVVDGLINDGLWDIYNNQHMGNCGEACASKYGITREDQDAFAIQSYERAAAAWKSGKFDFEVAPISIAGKKGTEPTVIVSGKFAREHNLTPLFKIRGFGDAARDPVEFTVAPSDAVPRALKHAGVSAGDVHFHEINEAFSVVPLVNARLLNLDLTKVNAHGGAVALGHPIGSSGSRIIGTLYSVLKANDATIGCASICNGGGAASAIVIERLN